jgi:hypothetical protein
MKHARIIGVIACIGLIISCFLPWTYYADLGKTFTGFFSEQNMYGKPGKYLTFFSVVSIVLILLPKIWAKRVHLFLAALSFGYAIRTFILFISCYNTYCPEKKYGIWMMIICCFIIFIASIFPELKISNENVVENVPDKSNS